MKTLLQKSLQQMIGLQRYLFVIAMLKAFLLRWNRKERNFRLFLSLLPQDARVIDIGANIGVMTALLARKCRSGKVYSFEPIPENFRVLGRVCRTFRLGNVELFQLALGEKAGELQMVMPKEASVFRHGLSHVLEENRLTSTGKTYSVRQERLDDLAPVFSDGVDAIKIDVENFEIFVLRGALELLQAHRPLIYMELWYGERRNECMRLLRDELGYTVKVWERYRLVDFEPDRHRRQDFFFVWDRTQQRRA